MTSHVDLDALFLLWEIRRLKEYSVKVNTTIMAFFVQEQQIVLIFYWSFLTP